jgi:hypothetical protein
MSAFDKPRATSSAISSSRPDNSPIALPASAGVRTPSSRSTARAASPPGFAPSRAKHASAARASASARDGCRTISRRATNGGPGLGASNLRLQCQRAHNNVIHQSPPIRPVAGRRVLQSSPLGPLATPAPTIGPMPVDPFATLVDLEGDLATLDIPAVSAGALVGPTPASVITEAMRDSSLICSPALTGGPASR